MTEVDPQQRQNAKTAAANAAVAANDTAAVLGIAGVAVAAVGASTGLGAPAGLFVGGVLAVGSFVAWGIGNRYQRLANDPPRDDFDQVSISEARLDEGALPADELLASFVRYAANQAILADALAALVTSLERFDGAVEAGDTDNADTQADAVQSNANLVVATHTALIDGATAINDAWSANVGDLDTSVAPPQDLPGLLSEAIGIGAVGLDAVFTCVSGLVEGDPLDGLDPNGHPLIVNGGPASVAELVSAGLNNAMTETSDPLSSIVS
ncbi:hypothetical protein [Nocardia sp. bgisy118]|uniref:hypothetical protein n=1 Tax=Nocardia sp. bgisy118 TaxID=3413786 RepID=UPI003F4A2395